MQLNLILMTKNFYQTIWFCYKISASIKLFFLLIQSPLFQFEMTIFTWDLSGLKIWQNKIMRDLVLVLLWAGGGTEEGAGVNENLMKLKKL